MTTPSQWSSTNSTIHFSVVPAEGSPIGPTTQEKRKLTRQIRTRWSSFGLARVCSNACFAAAILRACRPVKDGGAGPLDWYGVSAVLRLSDFITLNQSQPIVNRHELIPTLEDGAVEARVLLIIESKQRGRKTPNRPRHTLPGLPPKRGFRPA